MKIDSALLDILSAQAKAFVLSISPLQTLAAARDCKERVSRRLYTR